MLPQRMAQELVDKMAERMTGCYELMPLCTGDCARSRHRLNEVGERALYPEKLELLAGEVGMPYHKRRSTPATARISMSACRMDAGD